MNQIETFNRRLKTAKLGTRIEIRGERLYIVILLRLFPLSQTAPEKTDISNELPFILSTNTEGLTYAYDCAKLIGGQIATNSFNWNDWLNVEKSHILTIGQWIENAKEQYLGNGGKEDTWNNEYYQAYKRLPLDSPITNTILNHCLYDYPA